MQLSLRLLVCVTCGRGYAEHPMRCVCGDVLMRVEPWR